MRDPELNAIRAMVDRLERKSLRRAEEIVQRGEIAFAAQSLHRKAVVHDRPTLDRLAITSEIARIQIRGHLAAEVARAVHQQAEELSSLPPSVVRRVCSKNEQQTEHHANES